MLTYPLSLIPCIIIVILKDSYLIFRRSPWKHDSLKLSCSKYQKYKILATNSNGCNFKIITLGRAILFKYKEKLVYIMIKFIFWQFIRYFWSLTYLVQNRGAKTGWMHVRILLWLSISSFNHTKNINQLEILMQDFSSEVENAL